MILNVTLLLFYFLTPILIIYLTHINKTLNKVGSIAIAYLVGIVVNNIRILPRASDALRSLLPAPNGDLFLPAHQAKSLAEAGAITANDLLVNQMASMQSLVSNVVILLGIPLLLFSLDIKRWMHLAPEAMKSLILGVVSIIIVIFTGYLLVGIDLHEGWKVGGLLVGVYTGGTPNLVSIALALKVSPETFILTNTWDMVMSAFVLVFLMTIAQRIFNLFLPHFSETKRHKAICKVMKETEGIDNYLGMLSWKAFRRLGVAMAISLAIVAVSYGLGLLVPKEIQTTVIILSITTLGLLASLVPRINTIENTFQLG
ncbi:MAG TPA: DUF819 family protein, partial [Prolixibacteraceae bacterium]|nr:DUF819 family protein [Prolixibacteraceae bacterium]